MVDHRQYESVVGLGEGAVREWQVLTRKKIAAPNGTDYPSVKELTHTNRPTVPTIHPEESKAMGFEMFEGTIGLGKKGGPQSASIGMCSTLTETIRTSVRMANIITAR